MSKTITKPISLPSWASFRVDDKGAPMLHGQALRVLVNAPEMYEAVFAQLRAKYAKGHPDFNGPDGKITKEWADCLADLMSDTPSAYWCEVAYQIGKVDVQVACSQRGDAVSAFALNIKMADPSKKANGGDSAYAQKVRPQKRPVGLAAGGVAAGGKTNGQSAGREARAHYKRLRGFFPG